jgi:hypothetical protein
MVLNRAWIFEVCQQIFGGFGAVLLGIEGKTGLTKFQSSGYLVLKELLIP